jgi:Rrf2 family protein
VRLEVTRRADLAVRALTVLATAERTKAPVLAEALGSTPAFVVQVVGPLVRAGWVNSEPGPTGGYALAARLESVSVLDVIEAVDGATAGRCVVEDRACDPDVPCLLHVAWERARAELVATLAGVSVASLVEPDTVVGHADGARPVAGRAAARRTGPR